MKNKTDEMFDIRKWIYERADVYCNQKYGDGLPYSFHLSCVESQGEKFFKLLSKEDIPVVKAGLIMHENIEDFRMSYNDVKEVARNFYFQDDRMANYIENFDLKVAEIVYCVSDNKGRNRAERKNEKYYKELSENKLAVFVKLADISANTLFSKLTGSPMYNKYKSEFAHFKEMCYVEEYKEFFDYLEEL